MSKFRGSITLSIFSLSTLSNYHCWQSPKTRYWRLVRPYQTGIPPARLLALVWAHNPVLLDKYMSAGSVDGHYFLQDIYVASKILECNPANHYDIGSRVDGFIAHLLTGFKEEQSITMLDIRPLPVNIPKLNFIQTDATLLSEIEDESIYSLSSLHAVEHFGLGRYGDKIEPGACFTAMKAMQRVMANGGYLYFSVPIGTENATIFNAHRMFTPKTILDIFDHMELLEFSYIHDYKITTITGVDAKASIYGSKLQIHDYDCGIFIFRKN